jgi:sensor histidine kinase YesM
LTGNFTHLDSLSINNNIKEIQQLIKTVNIKLVDSLGNLTLTLDKTKDHTTTRVHNFSGLRVNGTIGSQEYMFSLDSLMNQEKRNIYFRYYIVRSLSKTRYNSNEELNIQSCIFHEEDPKLSNFTELDKFVVSKLYSGNFYDQFKSNFEGSIKQYYDYRYGDKIRFVTQILGIILGFCAILLLLKYRIITTEANQLSVYLKQGFITINCIIFFYLVSQSFAPYQYISVFRLLKIWIGTEIALLILLAGLYYLEQKIVSSRVLNKLLLQVFSTALFVYLFFVNYHYIISLTSTHKNYWSWEIELEQITILILVVCIRLIFNFVNFKNIQEIRKRDIELSQLKLLKSKAELQALHSRINPHFLYNSLNSIAALAHINPSKTEQMALALSNFFRYAINHKDQDMIEVSKEVDIARTYLQIEKVRFGEDLDFTIEIDNSIESSLIPRFLIQPLIENAVKHGVSVIQEKGIIKLEISKQKDNLFVKVFDNGPDFPDSPISGYGLQNLYEKLELLYGESAKISWENQPNKNICIKLPFTPKSV